MRQSRVTDCLLCFIAPMMDIFGDSLIEWSIDAEQKRSCSLSFSSLNQAVEQDNF